MGQGQRFGGMAGDAVLTLAQARKSDWELAKIRLCGARHDKGLRETDSLLSAKRTMNRTPGSRAARLLARFQGNPDCSAATTAASGEPASAHFPGRSP